ncbi:MAG: hypothetical protein P1U40_09570 [Coxiellaceae bacterium]|nr:hypothetical protein [Coxiellaceae bacterium]
MSKAAVREARESHRTRRYIRRGKNHDPFTRREFYRYRYFEPHYPRFSHAVLCPVRASNSDTKVEKDVDDLISHGRNLIERLERKRRNKPVMIRADYKNPYVDIAGVASVNQVRTIYVIGHCNGRMFGSEHYGVIDYTAEQLADWLDKTGLMRPGVKVKLMGCNTASIMKSGEHPFAKMVARKLRVRGVSVAGYDGTVRESTRLGGIHSCSIPLYSMFDKERARDQDRGTEPATEKAETLVRASDVRVNFRS